MDSRKLVPLNYQTCGKIVLLTLSSPPVNALGIDVRQAIVTGFEKANADPSVDAIILICDGKTFFAGADINEFGKPPLSPQLRQVIETVEASDKLTVAAMHGTALGGGLELALGCQYRIALDNTKIGLPEVKLGLLPGAGGTIKLPYIVGVEAALEIITSGRMIGASEANELGVLDKLVVDSLRQEAINYAEHLIQTNSPKLHVKDRTESIEKYRGNNNICDAFRAKNIRKFRGFMAPEKIIQSINAAVDLSFEQAMIRERELFNELIENTQSGAQRHLFFAERQTSTIPDIPKSTAVREISQVAVIGAGTMVEALR